MSRTLTLLTGTALLVSGLVFASFFVPRVRDKVFTTRLWPWPLPWDVTETKLKQLKGLARPGDIVVESNLHGWQWMVLSFVSTGTTWVHAAIVDSNRQLLTVHKACIEADWNIYLDWGSTRMALLRPRYKDVNQVERAIAAARKHLGVDYDPTFQRHAGNCNGLVASSLKEAGIEVKTTRCFGRDLYAPDCFFHIPDVSVIWTSDER